MASQTAQDARCAAQVYRGQWSTLRREPCGKPMKVMRQVAGSDVPVCGIHKRARWIVYEVAPGRSRGGS